MHMHLSTPPPCNIIIIITFIIKRRPGTTSHTSHGTRSMQQVPSVPLGGPVVSYWYASATSHCIHLTVQAEASGKPHITM